MSRTIDVRLRSACALTLLLLFWPEVISIDLKITALDESPERALMTRDAADASANVEAPELSIESLVTPAEPGEPLAIALEVCAAAEIASGAAGAIAGGGGRFAILAAEAAARGGIPLLLLPPPKPSAPIPTPTNRSAMPLYVDDALLAEACLALAVEKNWKRAVLLADRTGVAALLAPDDSKLALLARKLPSDCDFSLIRTMMLVLKSEGESRFVVWTGAECAAKVLSAAQAAGMLGPKREFILATDVKARALSRLAHGGANVTLFRAGGTKASATQAGALLARAAHALALPPMPAADCAAARSAFHADTLLNYLRSESQWVPSVRLGAWTRDSAQLQVAELVRAPDGKSGWLESVGCWSQRGLTWNRKPTPQVAAPRDRLANRTFRVLIAENRPYVMKKESMERLAGNERYEGFCIELIERLAELLQFNYTFELQADGEYGKYNNRTNSWNGMIGRLLDPEQEADLAITDLTITAERETAVDFTTPFMNLGISVMYRKPVPPEPEVFAFLLPFSNGVWMCLAAAYLTTSLCLLLVGRLCPAEWQNPHPCVEEPESLHNQFTLANALWFNLGAVLLQGSEIAPMAYGTRAMASAWWLFALVLTSMYTANLATLLAKTTSSDTVRDVKDLVDPRLEISYGAKAGGSTFTFFENSESKLYKMMFKEMIKQEMPKSNAAGIEKVEKNNYAFLMESTTIEYEIERNCNVTQVGGLLDNKGYGIAMKKGSPYRQALNLALLKMQEAGELRAMKRRWWKEKHGGGACTQEDKRESTRLSINNFRGLFYLLATSCCVGILISLTDLARASKRRADSRKLPFIRVLRQDLRFVLRFDQQERPFYDE